MAAGPQANDPRPPDAPYIGLKGRYCHVLGCTRYDAAHLGEVAELKVELMKWADRSRQSPDGNDLSLKLLRLYDHIVEHYPRYECSAILAKLDAARLRARLYKDPRAELLSQLDIFTIPVEQVVSSPDKSMNTPVGRYGGKTLTQVAFEALKKQYRRPLIDRCRVDRTWYYLLETIFEKCAETDPEIVELAKAAKAEISQREQFIRDRREQLLRERNAAE